MDDLDDLELLSKDELIEILLERADAGVNIAFPGKAVTRRMARRVRPRVQRSIAKYSVGSPDEQARNVLLEGDNLQAMVTLYRERGHVDLILTDPPYNTGNDFRYNDRWDEDPNDPGLGEFVSPDDRARHTKWMKFMYPRLQMMRAMLKPGGVLAICIDERELFHLGQMLDEIFKGNRIAIINWQKSTALKNDNGHVSASTDYVLVYAKDRDRAKSRLLPRDDIQNSRYSNPDGDLDGVWREGQLHVRTWVAKDDYGIQSPFTGEIHYPPGKSAWRHPKRDIKMWLEEWGSEYVAKDLKDDHAPALVLRNDATAKARKAAEGKLKKDVWPFIWFGRKGDGVPRKKIHLKDVKAGKIPDTFWSKESFQFDDLGPDELGSTAWAYTESGRSSDGAAELTAIVGEDHGFETVKPLKLFRKLITVWCPPGGLILDPFAGSGTTGHAVLELNHDIDDDRRFILVEQGRPDRGDSYARTLTADRLRRVINGKWAQGGHDALGGGFVFRELTKQVDARALLQMEREEMVDTVIASYFDAARRRGANLSRYNDDKFSYLVAKNSDDEGFYLVWGGAKGNTDLTEDVYEACVAEGALAGLKPTYHVYARYNLFSTEGVQFYQIPDRILADFGLDVRTESYDDEDPA
jgi:adenine-specific DNA-methyltransferase